MLRLLMATLLVLPSFAQDKQADRQAPPDPKVVEATIAKVETAFKEGRTPDKLAALKAAAKVPDEKVVDAIARGLKDKENEVLIATFDALRWNRHEAAIDALEKHYKRHQKKLKKDAALLPPLLRAIGWHGRESSIPILVEDPFSLRRYDVIQARLYGLGNIRSPKSVEALASLLKKVSVNKAEDYMGDLRLVLYRLSGVDNGPSLQLWGAWWRDVKKGYELPATTPVFNEVQQQQWDAYWGIKKKKKDGDGGR